MPIDAPLISLEALLIKIAESPGQVFFRRMMSIPQGVVSYIVEGLSVAQAL